MSDILRLEFNWRLGRRPETRSEKTGEKVVDEVRNVQSPESVDEYFEHLNLLLFNEVGS